MSLIRRDLTLDSAVLSGGAVIIAAGGGLPRRISMEEHELFGVLNILGTGGVAGDATPGVLARAATGSGHGQPAIWDDKSALFSWWGAARTRRMRPNSQGGTFVWQRTDLQPIGSAFDRGRNEVYIGRFRNNPSILVLDGDTGATKRSWNAGAPNDSSGRMIFDAARDEVYSFDWEGPGVRVFSPTGTLIRSGALAISSNFEATQVGLVNDEIIRQDHAAAGLVAWNRLTFALIRDVTTQMRTSSFSNIPDHRSEVFATVGFSIPDWCSAPDGKSVWILSAMNCDLFALNPQTRLGTVLHHGTSFRGQQLYLTELGGTWQRFAYMGASPTHVIMAVELRSFCSSQRIMVRHTVQTALWTVAFPALLYPDGVSIKNLAVPVKDRGHCVCECRVGAGAWTAFSETANLNLAVPAGGTLDIRVTMTAMNDLGRISYIAGDGGEGPVLIADDPNATVYVPVPITGIGGSLTISPATGGAAILVP